MFYFESKNQYLNFLADVFYMCFVTLALQFCGEFICFIVFVVILPIMSAIEVYIEKKKHKALPEYEQKILLGRCVMHLVFVVGLCIRLIEIKCIDPELCIGAVIIVFGYYMYEILYVTLQYVMLLSCKKYCKQNNIKHIRDIAVHVKDIITQISHVCVVFIVFASILLVGMCNIQPTIIASAVFAIAISIKHIMIYAWKKNNREIV